MAFQIYGALLGLKIDETANSNTSYIEKKQEELFLIGRISVLFNNYRNYDFSLTFSFFVPYKDFFLVLSVSKNLKYKNLNSNLHNFENKQFNLNVGNRNLGKKTRSSYRFLLYN